MKYIIPKIPVYDPIHANSVHEQNAHFYPTLLLSRDRRPLKVNVHLDKGAMSFHAPEPLVKSQFTEGERSQGTYKTCLFQAVESFDLRNYEPRTCGADRK